MQWLPMVVPKYLLAGLLKLAAQNKLIKDQIDLQQQNARIGARLDAAPALHFRQLMQQLSSNSLCTAAEHGTCVGSRCFPPCRCPRVTPRSKVNLSHHWPR